MTDQTDRITVRRLNLLQDPIPHDIRGAFDAAGRIHLEFGLPWLRNLATTGLPEGEAGYLYVARAENAEFLALPVRLGGKGGGVHALSTYYSSLWAPVVCCADPQPFYRAVFNAWARVERFDTLTLSPLDPASACYRDLQTALSGTPWRGLHDWRCFVNWIHPVAQGAYAAYLAGRPSRLRNTIRRRTRQLLAEDKGALEIVDDIRNNPDAAGAFQAVYANSWKPPEPFPGFIPGLLQTASEQGWLRLGLARYRGRPIAAQIWLLANSRAAIFKLAYDEAFRSLSPGTVLTAYMMEYVIERDRAHTIDYLTGDDGYKRDWMSEQRDRRGIAAYNPATLSGATRWLGHRGKRLLKHRPG